MSVNILSIETATSLCSVSLAINGKTIKTVCGHLANMHASCLTVFIDDLLKEVGMKFSQISAIAVSMGPGSYTGLRIGVSVAKGLCYALDIPLIANNTLDSLMFGFGAHIAGYQKDCLYFPMIDARRMEVYTQAYDALGSVTKPTHALIVGSDTFDGFLLSHSAVVLFGPGADKFKELFKAKPNVKICESFTAQSNFQDKLSYDKFMKNEFEDVAYFEPYYLKDFMVTPSKKTILS